MEEWQRKRVNSCQWEFRASHLVETPQSAPLWCVFVLKLCQYLKLQSFSHLSHCAVDKLETEFFGG